MANLAAFGARLRRAFTLVELLVVISIIGMLMALLLPAVQQAREAGRSNTCRNNLRNCTLAVLSFESARRQYPGYREPMAVVLPGDSNPSLIPVSWVVTVLPYLERKDAYALWRNPQAAVGAGTAWPPQIYIDVLNCPSSPAESGASSPCVYVVNSGMADHYPVGSANPAPYPADWRANGVFFNHCEESPGNTAPLPFAPRLNKEPIVYVSQDYISANDGTSTTLMLAENNNVPLKAPAFVGPSGLSGSSASWGDPITAADEKIGSFIWWPDKFPDPAMQINGVDTHPANPSLYYYFFLHPASNHPSGANVSFCDGHVRFLNQDIDYFVFCLLMSPDTRYCNTPGTVGGLDGDPGVTTPPWGVDSYPSGTNNYAYLRSAPLDESKVH